MTLRVTFNADQAFLSMIKRTIKRLKKFGPSSLQLHEVEECATCIILCQSAMESLLNLIADEHLEKEAFEDFDKLTFIDKFNYLYKLKGKTINWSNGCFQKVRHLNKIRNWLIHFKDGDIGLISSSKGWLLDKHNKSKNYDIHKELCLNAVIQHYNETRKSLHALAKLYDWFYTDSYISEKYDSYLVG